MKKKPAAKKSTWTSQAVMSEIERQQQKVKEVVKKKQLATLPAIRLRPGTWVAMDNGPDSWFSHTRKPKPIIGPNLWGNNGGNKHWIPSKVFNTPRIPKSQWNKHLYRVGKSGELIRVEME